MADEEVTDETAEQPERHMVRVRLKKQVIETPVRKTVTVNGEEFKLRSDAVVEVPDFVLDVIGGEFELMDENDNPLPPEEAAKVLAKEEEEKATKRKPRSRHR